MLMFDSYSDSESNIKSQTWETRNKNPVRYHLNERTDLKGLKMKDILESHPENKRCLTKILSDFFIKSLGDRLFVVESNVPCWIPDGHIHFEADTLLICVLNETMKLLSEGSSILSGCYFHIISPDTDVLILAIDYIQQMTEDVKIDFQLITSKGSRQISVNSVVSVLGKDH